MTPPSSLLARVRFFPTSNGMASATVENYIKQILLLLEEHPGETVSLGRLAARMGVSPGTTTTMAKSMAKDGLLRYEARRGVALTPQGEKLALKMLRKHRLVEMFLVSVLQLDWAEINEEAELLEHAVSDRLLEKIDAWLGHPKLDPHGDPIPSPAGKMIQRTLLPLADVSAGAQVRIAWIQQQDAPFLRYVLESGLVPGNFLRIVHVDPVADFVQVSFDDGKTLTLGGKAARAIQVEAVTK